MKELVEALEDLLGFDMWGDFPEGWYLAKYKLLLQHGREVMDDEWIRKTSEYVTVLEECLEGE